MHCLSVDDEDLLDSVTDLCFLLRVTLGQDHTTPVILVGNKVDQVDSHGGGHAQ